jgi:hypothetical protein
MPTLRVLARYQGTGAGLGDRNNKSIDSGSHAPFIPDYRSDTVPCTRNDDQVAPYFRI